MCVISCGGQHSSLSSWYLLSRAEHRYSGNLNTLFEDLNYKTPLFREFLLVFCTKKLLIFFRILEGYRLIFSLQGIPMILLKLSSLQTLIRIWFFLISSFRLDFKMTWFRDHVWVPCIHQTFCIHQCLWRWKASSFVFPWKPEIQ